mgnify:CR=1 FL=1
MLLPNNEWMNDTHEVILLFLFLSFEVLCHLIVKVSEKLFFPWTIILLSRIAFKRLTFAPRDFNSMTLNPKPCKPTKFFAYSNALSLQCMDGKYNAHSYDIIIYNFIVSVQQEQITCPLLPHLKIYVSQFVY